MSAFFDPEDKKNKEVLDYFANKTCLVIDVSAATRTSIKKSISQLGFKLSNTLDADNFVDAQKCIDSKKPHYVIGQNKINGGSTVGLFKNHLQAVPNRLNAGFFILAEAESTEEIALELEFEMDGIIALPFSASSIIDSIFRSVKHKTSPTPYCKKIDDARASLIKGNQERAMEIFQTAVVLHKAPYEGLFYLGEIHNEMQLLEKALSYYEQSYGHNAEFFKTLNKLRTIYYENKDFKKAYDLNLVMAQKFPTPPKKIPELIRLSIINQKYEDITNYLSLYHSFKSPDIITQTYLSAGLAILGKYLIISHDMEKGIEALKGSFKFSNGKYEILKSISQTFDDCNKLQILLQLFEEIDLDQWPNDAQVIYFHTFHRATTDDFQVITIGERLLKKKIKDVLLYKGMIERSVKARRKSAAIEALLIEATRDFPDHKDEFESLVPKST